MQSIFTPLPKTLLIHFELVAQKRDIEAIVIDTYGDFLSLYDMNLKKMILTKTNSLINAEMPKEVLMQSGQSIRVGRLLRMHIAK